MAENEVKSKALAQKMMQQDKINKKNAELLESEEKEHEKSVQLENETLKTEDPFALEDKVEAPKPAEKQPEDKEIEGLKTKINTFQTLLLTATKKQAQSEKDNSELKNTILEQNAKIEKLTEKINDMEIGFEYIKMYGFQSGHFEEVLAAYRKTGKFPNPEDFKNKQGKDGPKTGGGAGSAGHLEEYIDGLTEHDPFAKPQVKDRETEQPASLTKTQTIVQRVSMDIVDKLQVILMCTIISFAISYFQKIA